MPSLHLGGRKHLSPAAAAGGESRAGGGPPAAPPAPGRGGSARIRPAAPGFERLKDKEAIKIERIKTFLRNIVQQEEIPSGFHLTEKLSSYMGEDYSALSQLFSSLEGMTLEKYFIGLKIERVKELLFYEERTLSELAYLLDYSSVQHLSAQFKKVTGMTPSAYKKGLLPGGKGWREA
ncbi:AraC family transcriptional regulator [Nitritalea halalkaliphila LW7]|uniref:AraC family transcriptional regulator n=1 Tax=Nitritalea halalkaliphila LW7 TaxID=1189621 RepID=I5BZ52_9BACT|nr:AraC family transcriptional regulator [Nitritalea halalkaliphila]EIM74854.1 AraC family transcriptional regulator [Nitritalea halalkaliphila LW7]